VDRVVTRDSSGDPKSHFGSEGIFERSCEQEREVVVMKISLHHIIREGDITKR
jgi:hypothetical protein